MQRPPTLGDRHSDGRGSALTVRQSSSKRVVSGRGLSAFLVIACLGTLASVALFFLEPDPGKTLPGKSDTQESSRPNSVGPASLVTAENETPKESPTARVQRIDVPTTPALEADIPGNYEGVLELSVVDDETGSPLPEIEFQVFSERRMRHYARGKTDEFGRATIHGLPEDTVIVESARQPPHAITWAATWLPENATRHLELRAARGGTISGRVVNEHSQPVEGVEVFLTHASPGLARLEQTFRESLGITDEHGHYSVHAVRDRARKIWIRDGQPSPEHFLSVSLVFTFFNSQSFQRTSVVDGQEVTLPDVVIESPEQRHGIVLSQDRTPVAGALVSMNPGRLEHLLSRIYAVGRRNENTIYHGPSEEGFELEPGEALTGPDGRFTLTGRATVIASVWTADGYRHSLPDWWQDPNEFRELVLPPQWVVHVKTIVEGTHRPAPSQGAHNAHVQFLDGSATSYALVPRPAVVSSMATAPTDENSFDLSPMGPGQQVKFSLFLDRPAETVAALEIQVPKYLPHSLRVEEPLFDGAQLEVVLEPKQAFAVHGTFRIQNPVLTPDEPQRQQATVRVFLNEDDVHDDLRAVRFHTLSPTDSMREFEFEVPKLPYWVVVAGSFREADERGMVGPFGPYKDATESIELPPLTYVPVVHTAKPKPTAEELWTEWVDSVAVPYYANALHHKGKLRLELVEEGTGDPIPTESLRITGGPADKPENHHLRKPYRQSLDGNIVETSMLAGNWDLVLETPGYEKKRWMLSMPKSGHVETTVAFTRQPMFRGRLRAFDGSGVAGILVRSTGNGGPPHWAHGEELDVATVQDDGTFEVLADISDPFLWVQWPGDLRKSGALQMLSIDGWEPGIVHEWTLPRLASVVLEIELANPSPHEEEWGFSVPLVSVGEGGAPKARHRGTQIPRLEAHLPRMAYRVSPGEYTLSHRRGPVIPDRIQVRDDNGPQVFRIRIP